MKGRYQAVAPLTMTILGALFALRAEAIGLQVLSDSITRVGTSQALDAGIQVQASIPGLDIRHDVTAGGVLVSGRIASQIGPALLIEDGIRVMHAGPAIQIAGEVIGQILNQSGQLISTAANPVAVDFQNATGESKLDFVQTGDAAVTTGSILGRAGFGDSATFHGGTFTGESLIVDILEVSTAVNQLQVTGAGGFSLPQKTTVLYSGDHNPPANPLINVTQTLTASAGSTVETKAADKSAHQEIQAAGNKTVVVARAANIVGGENISVRSSTVLLDATKDLQGNELRVVLQPKASSDISRDIVAAGTSDNHTTAFIKAYEAVMASTDNRSNQAFNILNVDSQAVKSVADAIAPDDSVAVPESTLHLGRLAIDSVALHLDEESDIYSFHQPKSVYFSDWDVQQSSNEDSEDKKSTAKGGFWARVIGSQAGRDSHDGFYGYKTEIRGVTIGADTGSGKDYILGGALTHATSGIDSKQSGRKTDTTSYLGTLYGAMKTDYGFTSAMLNYGFGQNETRKWLGGSKVTGNYDSHQWGVNLKTGFNFTLGENWVWRPLTALNWQTVSFDKYREKGSTGLEQEIKADRYSVLELGAGVDMKGSMSLGDGVLIPSVSLMGWYGFDGRKNGVEGRYLIGGDGYKLNGPRRKRWRYQGGIGVDYMVNDQLRVELDYTHDRSSGFKADNVSLKLRYDF
ncbi:autotransporter family protein [Spongorhabdus nitratireducens]